MFYPLNAQMFNVSYLFDLHRKVNFVSHPQPNLVLGGGEVPVGRAQLRGGSRGGGAGRLHPVHRALERADRPLVPWHAGSITIHYT